MIPTPGLTTRLRKLLDERIPEGSKDSDTRFLDEDLDELLIEARSIYEAASVGWTMKAGMFQAEMGDVERVTLGQETEALVSLEDRVDYALRMAEKYEAIAKASAGSVVLKLASPEVL